MGMYSLHSSLMWLKLNEQEMCCTNPKGSFVSRAYISVARNGLVADTKRRGYPGPPRTAALGGSSKYWCWGSRKDVCSIENHTWKPMKAWI